MGEDLESPPKGTLLSVYLLWYSFPHKTRGQRLAQFRVPACASLYLPAFIYMNPKGFPW